MVDDMKTGTEGIKLIKQFEGCKLTAYKCPAGLWTIGYGNTYYEDSQRVKEGDKITQERAEQLLLNLLPKYEAIVNKSISVTINQNQFDSLVSFTWNTGGSTNLFKMINEKTATKDIAQWIRTHYITAAGKVLNGLVTRRNAEAKLFEQ